ncbi:MAG: hypothetical protein QXH96_00475 [Candidatus Geothermarchaeota archaeon]
MRAYRVKRCRETSIVKLTIDRDASSGKKRALMSGVPYQVSECF